MLSPREKVRLSAKTANLTKGSSMRRQSETCFLVALALITSTLGLSFASAQQKIAREETSVKDKFTENFLAQHEIGRRFRIDPAELPAPKTSAIVTNRSLTVP